MINNNLLSFTQGVVKAISDSDCANQWVKPLRKPTFCKDVSVSNTCSGDSGGPNTLMVTRDGTTRQELYGVNSYGGCSGRCNCHFPKVAAEISETSKLTVR